MDKLKVIESYLVCLNNGTFAENADIIVDPDAVMVTGDGQEHRGLENFVAASTGFFDVMPDVETTLVDFRVNGDRADISLRMNGTFTGEMKTQDGGTIPGNGEWAEWEPQAELEFRDGKIVRWTTIVDMQDFVNQLGLG
jgi:predicted ester cyclase